MRCPWWLTANRSLASASARMTTTSAAGSHWSAVEVSAATATEAASAAASATTSNVERVDIRRQD
jgi:hypothetical protein